jgi:hypothetical protein
MTPKITRTEKEINDQIQKALDGQDSSAYPSMSYEQGMLAMYDWLIGQSDDLPIDD